MKAAQLCCVKIHSPLNSIKMKSKILLIVTIVTLLVFPKINFGQINLGASANFVIYTTGGSVHDNPVAHSHLTGDVGYFTSGDFLGFGNVNGVMHPGVDPATTACDLALQSAVAQINSSTATLFPGLLLGNGVVYTPGVYEVPGNATLNLDFIIDAQGDPNAVFIFKINGTFATTAGSKVKLINQALACNVFWKVEGQIDMATNSTMRGTMIANNAAINMAAGDSIEGRVLSTTGAITIDGITGYTPQGCGSPVLTGPPLPTLASIACYTIFSSIGALDGNSSSTSIGDVGNAGGGSVTGWTAGNVTGILHPTGDPSTMLAATDLLNLYNTLDAMIPDIELLYPAQFGHDLVLTPHVYLMNGATSFTDSIYLDAQGNSNAVFVIKIIGATCDLTTSVYSRVKLVNGAKPENVFWMVKGAVSINDNSIFNGTIVVPAGAINLWYSGVKLNGRALTVNGAITTAGLTAVMPPGCGVICAPNITTQPVNQTACVGDSAKFWVAATGTGLTYQWRKGIVNIIGATSDTLKINPVSILDAALDYNVVIIGTCLPNDTSINVSLTVNSGPIITMQPANQIACVGDSVSFTVAATGSGLTYQWRKGLANIIGATNDTLTINPVSALDFVLNYNVIVTGTCSKDTSINASLTSTTAPVIILQPLSQIACLGDSVSFTVAATGTGLAYQWRKGLVNIIGATNDTLTINPVTALDAALNYNVVITGTCLLKDTSFDAALTISSAINITAEPANQIACVGDSVSFSVMATGAGLTYQWRKGTVNIIGATSATLTIDPVTLLDAALNYNVIITGTCSNDTSIYVSLTVNIAPDITAEPSDQIACTGSSVSFSVMASGTGLTYQWRKGTVNILGATTASLTIDPVSITDAALNYNVVVSGTCFPNDTSINVSLTVNVTPIAIANSNSPVCVDSLINLYAQSVTGGTYLWAGPNAFSSSDQNPVITASTAYAGIYTLVVSANGCPSAPSTITMVIDACEIVVDFNIPEGFSPNSDGINDLFVIRGIDRFPANKIVIYNRWGDKVYEANPYQNTWDGKSTLGLKIGGDKLPIGTYFYVLDLGDGSKIYKGTIYLNR